MRLLPAERAAAPPRLRQGGAAIGQEDRLLGCHREGAFAVPQRGDVPGALPRQHGQQVVGVRLGRRALQDLAVEPLGRGQVAGRVARGAVLQQRIGILGGHGAVIAAGQRRRNRAAGFRQRGKTRAERSADRSQLRA